MKNGLKGVTDATVFCKSMKKGGSAPIIKSMKSYEVGGATEQCGPGDKFKKACKKAFKSVGKSVEKKGSVLGTVVAGALGGLGYGAYKKMKSKE